jgi:hypothetical protein
MKAHLLILLLIVLPVACSKYTNSETENSQELGQNSPVIFEIQEDADGMRRVKGKILLFRLHKNRIAEYDFYDEQRKNSQNSNKAEDVFTLKWVKISEAEFEKFQALFDSQDFQKDFQISKESYQSKCCCTDDSGMDYIVKFESGNRQKTVVINNVCELNQLTNRDTRNSADIPVSLSELIRMAYVTQLKYINKK